MRMRFIISVIWHNSAGMQNFKCLVLTALLSIEVLLHRSWLATTRTCCLLLRVCGLTSTQSNYSDRVAMGVQKKTRKFATVKRIIGQRDARLKKNQGKAEIESKKQKEDEIIREVYDWNFLYSHCVLIRIGLKYPLRSSSNTIPPSSHLTMFLSIPISCPTRCRRSSRCCRQ